MKLTKPQREELQRLAKEPQPTFGAPRTRVQNTLCRLGLAFFGFLDSNISEVCQITEAGRAALRSTMPMCCCAGPDYHPDKPCPVHPKVTAT